MTGRLAAALLVLSAPAALAQPPGTNQDEVKVPPYTLPDPLILQSGERVTDAATWESKRRPEILRLFETHVYGKTPGRPDRLAFEVKGTIKDALGGKATRKEITILFAGMPDGPRMDLALYVPNAGQGPRPTVVSLNFGGNHAVDPDPRVPLARAWEHTSDPKKSFHPDDATRGKESSRWPLEHIIDRGYAVATAYYGDIDPDFDDGFKNGVHPLFDRPGQTRAADAWGSIAAWAWGLSRAMDYLETDRDVDAKRVIVMGHSRLGKTALWAGATDRRFAAVVSNDSGEGGAALARRQFGERVENLVTSFPHWFCLNYRRYAGHEDQLPIDQHELIALIAPRPVYVASATEDRWADPRGEFLSALAADPVYRLFGLIGLGTDHMPAPDHPVGDCIGYHLRTGKHDVTAYDWDQYLRFADRHFKRASDSKRD
jgi:hypothetical protein